MKTPISFIIETINNNDKVNYYFLEDNTSEYKFIIVSTTQHKFTIRLYRQVNKTTKYLAFIEHIHWSDSANTFYYPGVAISELSIDNSRLPELFTLIEDKSGKSIFPEWWSYVS